MSDWQVRVETEWIPLGVGEVRTIEKLELLGQRIGRATLQGQEYEFDIGTLTLKNCCTGVVRRVRRVDKKVSRNLRAFTGGMLSHNLVPHIEPARVTLHVYDVGVEPNVRIANGMLHLIGAGAYHTGVEVYGLEWSYAKRSSGNVNETGVFWCEPKKCPRFRYRESVDLGVVTTSQCGVDAVLDALSVQWKSAEYDLLLRNCNGFCDDFLYGLGLAPMPSWVVNLADAGAVVMNVVGSSGDSPRRRLSRLPEDTPRQAADDVLVDFYRPGDVERGLIAPTAEPSIDDVSLSFSFFDSFQACSCSTQRNKTGGTFR